MNQDPFICVFILSFCGCYALYRGLMSLSGGLLGYLYSLIFDSIAMHFPFGKPSQPAPYDHLTVFQTVPQFLQIAPSHSLMKEHDR